MTKKIAYRQGDLIGRRGLIYIKETRKVGYNKYIQVLCPAPCPNTFEARLDNVKADRTTRCPRCRTSKLT